MIYTRTIALVFTAALATAVAGQTPATSQTPAIRQIPGITAKDAYPNGCVDCHVAGKDGDMRMSALMTKWTSAVSAALLERTKSASVDPSKIKGKHPSMPSAKLSVPQTCLGCHKHASTIAPPFDQLLHVIHLVGGSQNRFLSAYQGECTHCHKLDQKTGTWKVASGVEK